MEIFFFFFFTGHLMWFHKLWPLTPLIIVAILVGCLIAVIILICIIICMCRRRRKRSSKSKDDFQPRKREAIRENHTNKSSLTLSLFSSFFFWLSGMEKSLVDNKPNDPNAEPCENYENLPFHGLQNPPTKVRLFFLATNEKMFILFLTLIAVVTFRRCWSLSSMFSFPNACFDYCSLLSLFPSNSACSSHSLIKSRLSFGPLALTPLFFSLTLIRLPWLFS